MTAITGGFLGRKGIIVRRPTTQETLEGKGVLDNVVQDKTTDLLVQAQICAALNRHVVDVTTPNIGQQNWSQSSTYYTAAPTNYYAKFWHQPGISLDQLSYGFAYDDVWNYSSSLHSGVPTKVVAVFGGYSNSGTNIPPTVSITSPSNGTAFTAPANIIISANASDDNGTITKVEFYDGSNLLGTDTSAPYSYTWSNVTNGNYSLTAIATDNEGATTTSSIINISVTSDNVPPTVSITSPSNGDSFTELASITINATASDTDGSITKVDFYNGSTLLGTDTSAPYSFTWNNVPAGTYSITAKATDNAQTSTTSSAINATVNADTGCSGTAANGDYSYQITTAPGTVKWTFVPLSPITGCNMAIIYINGAGYTMTASGSNFVYTGNYSTGQVLNFYFTYRVGNTGTERNSSANPHTYTVGSCTGSGNIAPSVSITAPSGGDSFSAPANITISADASDTDGSIANVDFYNGTTLIGSDNTAPYSITWSGVVEGTYSITAKATDNLGTATTSSAVSIEVSANISGGCSGTAVNGDYSYQVSTTSGTVNWTFIPLSPIQGCNLAIIYINGAGYTMTASGSNFIYSGNYASGQTLSFYFTYRVGTTGTERNSSSSPHSYLVGSTCTSSRLDTQNFTADINETVYPNPAQNVLHFSNISDNAHIIIRNLSGTKIINIKGQNKSLDISNLKKGMYVIQILDGKKIINKQLIKN